MSQITVSSLGVVDQRSRRLKNKTEEAVIRLSSIRYIYSWLSTWSWRWFLCRRRFFKGSSLWLFHRLSKPKRNLRTTCPPCPSRRLRDEGKVLYVMQGKFCMFVILAASADTFCNCKSTRSWQMELLLYKVITLLVISRASTANAIAYVGKKGILTLAGLQI